MKFLRTDDSRFRDLPGYPFSPHYVSVPAGDGDALRLHYLDEGPSNGRVVLLMHGEPTWSYLYRKMIPILVGAGFRVVAPDLIGFGRSDKPVDRADYTYARHVGWIAAFLAELDLRGITLVCQDWGSLVGLRVAAENPERFARIVLANGGLPTGDQKMPEAFFAWRKFSQEVPELPVGSIVNGGCTTDLPPEIVAAYDAPFPDESYKAGARQFPALVPASPDDPAAPANRAAWEVFRAWKKPFLTAFSDQDAITRGGEAPWQKHVPGAQGMPHTTIRDGGHFLQEDRGEELAEVVVDFIRRT
ncbi:MAG TPA: haloalkane dehalogenase [Polyangiaceae bacterium]|nr:haloalkane dehalogenase [Polyangiaceae bacterium]